MKNKIAVNESILCPILSKISESIIDQKTNFNLSKTNLIIAYSGGIDSTVLLDALIRSGLKNQLHVVHIDHQLCPQSKSWGDFCMRTCNRYDIPFTLEKIISPIPTTNMEHHARIARYTLLKKHLSNDKAILITGHQLDDQIETFFINLMRGSGIEGLSAMSEFNKSNSYIHYKPLLSISRTQIQQYASNHQLSWIIDPSNIATKHTRNALRKQLIPVLKQLCPSYQKTIIRSITHIKNQHLLNEERLKSFNLSHKNCLSIQQLRILEPQHRALILRSWLKKTGDYLPSKKKLEEILKQCLSASIDKQPSFKHGSNTIKRYKNSLYLIPNTTIQLATPMTLTFDRLKDHQQIICCKRKGLGLLKLNQTSELTICYRKGGERIHIYGSLGHRPLKKLFQDWHIPPWMRHLIPLIYYKNELISIPGYAVAHDFATTTAYEDGYELSVRAI
jgi:tRNA(Ile)-lysidine synthase